MERKAGEIGGPKFNNIHAKAMPIASYGLAVVMMLVFFLLPDGWVSELVPIIVYFVGTLVSGFVAMLGLMARRIFSQRSRVPNLGFLFAFLVIGVAWLFPATWGLEMLLVVGMVIAIAIPPLLVLEKVGRPSSLPTLDAYKEVAFAWCDKALEKGGPRSWMTTALTLLLTLGMGNFFATVFYLNTPAPVFSMQALMFFVGIAAGVGAFSIAFKARKSDLLILIGISITAFMLIINDVLLGFANSPVSLLVNGLGTGAIITLLLKFQAVRNNHAKFPDFPGNRTIEFFFYTFLAALFGLIFSLTVTWEGLRVDIPGYLPPRIIFGAIVVAFAIIILATFNSNARYLAKVEKGEVVKRSETMEDFIRANIEHREKQQSRKADAPAGAP